MTTTPLESLIRSGTKLWLDSIDPDLVQECFQLGATGATSNPVIVGDLLATGRFDQQIKTLFSEGLDNDAVAWQMTDRLVREAQNVFLPVWERTAGNDGYVSFEIDPLLEDPKLGLSEGDRAEKYVELATQWAAGHQNRMIKVPATTGGIAALEELCARGITLNVTLIFTARQYRAAREAVWRGAQRRSNLDGFKSVYSVFVSRVDAYASKHLQDLSAGARDILGIHNAKQIWLENEDFWGQHPTPLDQEIIFASTGTKNPDDDPWKYVAALAGSDIQTNPPATNDAVQSSNLEFTATVGQSTKADLAAEIESQVDFAKLEDVLLTEGIQKFVDPHRALLELIKGLRDTVSAA